MKKKQGWARRWIVYPLLLLGACAALWWFFFGLPRNVVSRLEDADTVEVLSLYPYIVTGSEEKEVLSAAQGWLHRWPILGKTTVTSTSTRRQIVTSLQGGALQPSMAKLCFSPRHAIRATREGQVVLELVICFECNQYLVLPDGPSRYRLTGSAAEPLLSKILRDAGIPIHE